jgi:hypothetical protein
MFPVCRFAFNCLGLLLLVSIFGVPVRAQTVYVIAGTVIGKPPVYLFGTISLKSGEFHLIYARTDYYPRIKALGFGANGKLYALRAEGDEQNADIGEYCINIATGDMTLQKKFADVSVYSASMDNQRVFTGFTLSENERDDALFTLDPASQTIKIGLVINKLDAQGLGSLDGLVVSDGQGNIYASSRRNHTDFGNDVLTKIINAGTGAAVVLGSTGILAASTGFFVHGRLYAFGEDGDADTYIYTFNSATGAASLVGIPALPEHYFVSSAALAPSVVPDPGRRAP